MEDWDWVLGERVLFPQAPTGHHLKFSNSLREGGSMNQV